VHSIRCIATTGRRDDLSYQGSGSSHENAEAHPQGVFNTESGMYFVSWQAHPIHSALFVLFFEEAL